MRALLAAYIAINFLRTVSNWSSERHNVERLRFYDCVKNRHDVTAKLDYSLAFARDVGCL
jgi:hypothetical protein